MSNRAPLSNSANRQASAPVAAPASDITPKILALIATIAAGAIAFLVRDQQQYIAGAALIGTVVAFGFIFIRSQNGGAEPAGNTGDATGDLNRTIETNRAEYNARLAELKKSLDAYKVDNSAAQENEAIRQEIGKLRAELAGLRGAISQR
jgi:hypothetical protein